MEPRGQIFTNNTEKSKGQIVNFRPRDDILTIGTNITGRSGGKPHTQTCGYVLRQQ